MAAEWAFEADVVGSERPAVVHVTVCCSEGERKDAPYQGIVEDGNMIRDGHQAPSAGLVVGARFEEIEEWLQIVDFSLAEECKKAATQEMDT